MRLMKELEDILNKGSIPEFIITGCVTKGLVGRDGKFSFRVFPNDHNPVHFHVDSKDGLIKAKYSVYPFGCISGGNPRLDKFVSSWFCQEDNRDVVEKEWKRYHAND